MSCKRIVYDFDHPGKVKEIEVETHSYAWSGKIPCTGVRKCIYCGMEEPNDVRETSQGS